MEGEIKNGKGINDTRKEAEKLEEKEIDGK